jgi:hypothetical protein
MSGRDGRLRVANEFAAVDIALRDVHNGMVLELSNPQSGERIWLDALEIEALTRLTPDDRRRLVDPSRRVVDHDPVDHVEGEMVGW